MTSFSLQQFLSTPPSRVATASGAEIEAAPATDVSIHATLAGGDADGKGGQYLYIVSIHATLAGGDSSVLFWVIPKSRVSIHATLAGGDYALQSKTATPTKFLSTPPSRVATELVSIVKTWKLCFYPRHPRGWRPLFTLMPY